MEGNLRDASAAHARSRCSWGWLRSSPSPYPTAGWLELRGFPVARAAWLLSQTPLQAACQMGLTILQDTAGKQMPSELHMFEGVSLASRTALVNALRWWANMLRAKRSRAGQI